MNLPLVVSNSSPIINLAIIGRLDLLKTFWGKIYVPEAVWQEVVIDGSQYYEVEQIRAADWIIVEKIENRRFAQALMQNLDKGEAEAITLALEKKADVILLDETDARETADGYQLNKTGVLGVLILAKLQRLINSLKEEIDNLRLKANFRIKNSLEKEVLIKVGELQ